MSLETIVQSSSAVTIATIGFVNAGMLTLRQALGVIFGTNVGTTMTGWLVSLVGFGFRIEALALPILTVGVVLPLAEANMVEPGDDRDRSAALERLQSRYRETKEALLDDLRATRRLVDQLLKADRLLRGPKWAAEIEAGVGTAGSG